MSTEITDAKRKIILAGGTGFLGQALAAHFSQAQFEVVVLTRTPTQSGLLGCPVAWDAASLGPWQTE